MFPHRKQRRREIVNGDQLEISAIMSFRKVETNEIEDLIRAQTAKLERVCDHMGGCKIAIENRRSIKEAAILFESHKRDSSAGT
jgi:hypothetical protein